MLKTKQIEAAKTNWIQHLTHKTAKWKGDNDIYIQNSNSLIMDSIHDIVSGIWTETPITVKKHRFQELKLDKKYNLPLEFMLRCDAIVAYAAENSIDIEYTIEHINAEMVVIKWVVNSCPEYFKLHHVSKRMESTYVKPAEVVEVEAATEEPDDETLEP
jgi:hypothetical protein